MSPAGPVVLGVDIGTSSVKVIGCDAAGSAVGGADRDYPLDNPRPGYAVQDPAVILAAVVEAIAECVAGLDRPVAGLSFSAGMHSLIGLDGAGAPLTPSVTWADQRATAQAERLRAGAAAAGLHGRTGTPVHPMSPLSKLCWYAEAEPDTFAAVRTWVGIKEYVLARLTGELVSDLSMASATGLFDVHRRDWDAEALAIAGVRRDQLPPVVGTRQVLPGLRADVADRTGLDRRTPVVVGAGDGPLANLGVGALPAGLSAVSLGTSGALRVTLPAPRVDEGLFCYALDEDRWVVGGAINNGGIVVRWSEDVFGADRVPGSDRSALDEWMLDLAGSVPAGCDGLLMLPYLLGERAPRWDPLPRGAYLGVRRGHDRAHFVRAAIEGVCLQLSLVEAAVEHAGHPIGAVRATGGAFRAQLWSDILAATLDREIALTAGPEGSSFGAALLGLTALGQIESLDAAAALVPVARSTRPRAADVARYALLRPIFAAATEALLPTFAALRGVTGGAHG
ncbi:gluconokinase [soil metagenome]